MVNSVTAIIVAVTAVLGICITIAGVCMGVVYGHSERITRLEERMRSLGGQMAALPKRKGD